MREAVNYCYIEGILNEVDLEEKSGVTKTGKHYDAIGGKIVVRVDTEDGVVEVPVSLWANKTTKDGNVSKGYLGLLAVKNNFKSVASTGSLTEADKVYVPGSRTFNNAVLDTHEFYNKDGKVVKALTVKAQYVYKVDREFKPRAEWNLDFMVASMHDRVDKDGVELNPRELEVQVIAPKYNDKLNLITLTVKNPKAIQAIEDGWETNKCYSASGKLNFTSTSRTVVEEADFGDPVEKVYTTNIHEVVVQRGSVTPMDEEDSWSPADINAALKAHRAELEASKDQNMVKTAPEKVETTYDLGF